MVFKVSDHRWLHRGVVGSDGNPLDAAKHGPSSFAAVHGDPVIMHDDLEHNRKGRHDSDAGYGKYGSGIH